MIDHISPTRFCHILTIEDPIEYVHRHGEGAVNQREVGKDTESFARGLRSALREDPDVLMVGEMRDLESIETVLTLAETGHLVIATLHTNDTTQAVDRLVGVFPGEQQNQARLQLSASLVGVVYQRLIPQTRGWPGRRLRGAAGHPRRAEPDPGEQHPPAPQRHHDGPGRRHADPRDAPVAAGGRRHRRPGRGRPPQPVPEGDRQGAGGRAGRRSV